MKQFILLSVLVSINFFAFSQPKIEVEIGKKYMSEGSQMAISVFIPEARMGDVETVWKKYINNRSIGERIGNLATQVGNVFKSEENEVRRD